jgi:hypothetical protein
LHAFFPQTKDRGEKAQGEMLELRRLSELIADKYHVHNLELCSTHFESTQGSYLRDLQVRLKKAHVRVINMPVDYPHERAVTNFQPRRLLGHQPARSGECLIPV